MRRDIKKEFLEAYDLHVEAIYRHCFFRVHKKQQAEDLAQETFIKTWIYLSEGNIVQNMRALLYKIANNLIIDYSRKKQDEQLDMLLENDQIEEPSYAGQKDIETQTMLSSAMEHLKKLPEEDQRLIVMRYIDDLDPKDIAEVTGLSVNNVSVKLHRAIKSLQQYIQ